MADEALIQFELISLRRILKDKFNYAYIGKPKGEIEILRKVYKTYKGEG